MESSWSVEAKQKLVTEQEEALELARAEIARQKRDMQNERDKLERERKQIFEEREKLEVDQQRFLRKTADGEHLKADTKESKQVAKQREKLKAEKAVLVSLRLKLEQQKKEIERSKEKAAQMMQHGRARLEELIAHLEEERKLNDQKLAALKAERIQLEKERNGIQPETAEQTRARLSNKRIELQADQRTLEQKRQSLNEIKGDLENAREPNIRKAPSGRVADIVRAYESNRLSKTAQTLEPPKRELHRKFTEQQIKIRRDLQSDVRNVEMVTNDDNSEFDREFVRFSGGHFQPILRSSRRKTQRSASKRRSEVKPPNRASAREQRLHDQSPEESDPESVLFQDDEAELIPARLQTKHNDGQRISMMHSTANEVAAPQLTAAMELSLERGQRSKGKIGRNRLASEKIQATRRLKESEKAESPKRLKDSATIVARTRSEMRFMEPKLQGTSQTNADELQRDPTPTRQLTVKMKTSDRLDGRKEDSTMKPHDEGWKAFVMKQAKMKYEPFVPKKMKMDHMDQVYMLLQDLAVWQKNKYSPIRSTRLPESPWNYRGIRETVTFERMMQELEAMDQSTCHKYAAGKAQEPEVNTAIIGSHALSACRTSRETCCVNVFGRY